MFQSAKSGVQNLQNVALHNVQRNSFSVTNKKKKKETCMVQCGVYGVCVVGQVCVLHCTATTRTEDRTDRGEIEGGRKASQRLRGRALRSCRGNPSRTRGREGRCAKDKCKKGKGGGGGVEGNGHYQKGKRAHCLWGNTSPPISRGQ